MLPAAHVRDQSVLLSAQAVMTLIIVPMHVYVLLIKVTTVVRCRA